MPFTRCQCQADMLRLLLLQRCAEQCEKHRTDQFHVHVLPKVWKDKDYARSWHNQTWPWRKTWKMNHIWGNSPRQTALALGQPTLQTGWMWGQGLLRMPLELQKHPAERDSTEGPGHPSWSMNKCGAQQSLASCVCMGESALGLFSISMGPLQTEGLSETQEELVRLWEYWPSKQPVGIYLNLCLVLFSLCSGKQYSDCCLVLIKLQGSNKTNPD